MKEQAIEVYETESAGAAVEYMQQAETDLSPAEHLHVFSDVMRHAYWEKKDLPSTIQIGQSGIAFSEQLLGKYPDQSEEIKSRIKAFYYDLASFTWPGWDEKGIEIDAEQMALGLEAARHNLRLAEELKKDALPCSRAHWMLAAQEIAARQYDQAVAHFTKAAVLARQADAEDEALLADGFVIVVGLLQNPGDEALKTQLEEIRETLRPMEHGKFFIAQLFDSLRMFSG